MRILRAAGHCIPVGGKDGQEPHSEDEVYVVRRGHGRLVSDTAEHEVGPGTVVHVPAREPHHFTDVTEDLSTVVVSAPAERGRGADHHRD